MEGQPCLFCLVPCKETLGPEHHAAPNGPADHQKGDARDPFPPAGAGEDRQKVGRAKQADQ